jgi:voltage-gated potassium channel
MWQALKHTIRAQWRDACILSRESRTSLVLFLCVLVGGALAFHLLYVFTDTQQRLSFAQALYTTFSLIFFEMVLPFPQPWYLQVLFFAIPILGLATIAEGVLRFGTALVNKQDRGQKWQVAIASTYRGHVIVCGLGKLGYRVVLELQKFGREVVGVELNPDGRFVAKLQALNVPVIIADARREEDLIKAGVERADAIIPCTDDELTNLDIALDARELNPQIKVVMRLFDPDLARRVEKGFGIHTAFSTSALAAPLFATAAMRIKTRYAFYVGENLLNLSQVTIEPGSLLVGWTIGKLAREADVSVVCYEGCQATDTHPDPERQLNAGDRLMVIGTLRSCVTCTN